MVEGLVHEVQTAGQNVLAGSEYTVDVKRVVNVGVLIAPEVVASIVLPGVSRSGAAVSPLLRTLS